jgi:hypothetical protein
MLKQKEAVISLVETILVGRFTKYKDNAILILTASELESVKQKTESYILSGDIEYSKDLSNRHEVRTYARSMVMNHLKKAKELNGNRQYIKATGEVSTNLVCQKVNEIKTLKGIKLEALTPELKEFVTSKLT